MAKDKKIREWQKRKKTYRINSFQNQKKKKKISTNMDLTNAFKNILGNL